MRSRFLVAVAVLVAAAYGLYLRSDAYRNGNRLFYSDRRPTRAGRVVGRALSIVYGSGLGPSFLVSLETVGRRSGRRSTR